MSFSSTTLRPGLLVSVNTSITGNVHYDKGEASEFTDDAGTLHADWETHKTVQDAAEQEAATKVRSKARNLIASVCASSAFGMLCPETKSDDLEKAIADARALCEEFNSTAKVTRVKFYAIAGRIAADDVEAVRAINGEVRDLINAMEAGLTSLDVEAVRKAANRAKQLGSMLSADAQVRIQIALDAARKLATKIVAAGEAAAIEIDRTTLTTLAEARTAFLDLDTPEREIALPDHQARAIDLSPELTLS